MTPKVIVILGATAVGKTALSLELAHALDAEIVNADSMQLYRGMDIGTAKIPESERQGITHHMFDVLDVTESAAVSDFQVAARAVIDDIHKRGKRAMLVGGSGLFIQSVLEDLQFQASDPEVRNSLNEEAERMGTAAMYARLLHLEPEAGAKVLPNNLRRIIRALEVVELTGKTPMTTLSKLPDVYPSIRVGLRRPRAELGERIEQRVALMWEQGLIDEVAYLESVGLREGVTASKALGYAQVLEAMDGSISVEQAAESTVVATKRFAKRQDSWFGRDDSIAWLDADRATVETVLGLI
jgi:tRNA dimethylallyltransferase